jgi:hypothetical protein
MYEAAEFRSWSPMGHPIAPPGRGRWAPSRRVKDSSPRVCRSSSSDRDLTHRRLSLLAFVFDRPMMTHLQQTGRRDQM